MAIILHKDNLMVIAARRVRGRIMAAGSAETSSCLTPKLPARIRIALPKNYASN
jgi:hypothetical protein